MTYSYRLKPNLPKIPCNELITEQRVSSFAAVGIFCYLAKSSDFVNFDELCNLSKIEHFSEIGSALTELMEAGLVEYLEHAEAEVIEEVTP